VPKQLGIQVTLETKGTSRQVDSTKAIHVYRVLQEALSNVARHSGADRAMVRLAFEPDRLEMEIEDHGKGLNPETARRGLGLVAMRERAAIVGGTLDFLKSPQGGTLLRLSMPL